MFEAEMDLLFITVAKYLFACFKAKVVVFSMTVADKVTDTAEDFQQHVMSVLRNYKGRAVSCTVLFIFSLSLFSLSLFSPLSLSLSLFSLSLSLSKLHGLLAY